MTVDEFRAAWDAFVELWDSARRSDGGRPAQLVRRALREGLEPPQSRGDGPTRPSPEVARRCEMAVIRASGLFRGAAYRKANREVRRQRIEPLEHFIDEGWRRLRNPSRDFDVWWYWSEYLDPRQEDINPLLHYALAGRFAGLDPVPPIEPGDPPVTYSSLSSPRRACLFAGYDPDGLVDDYVVEYIRELSRFADVYYLADGYMHPEELKKLDPLTVRAWARGHGAYDFGSYSLLARDLVGWETIDQYDELLLVNDSGFLLRPLDDLFETMNRRACDWWGLQATKHDFHVDSNGGHPLPLELAKATMVGQRTMDDIDHLHVSSYFLALRRPVHTDPGFRRRLDAVTTQSDKHLVIYKYEIGLSRYLMCRGFAVDTFIPDLYPFHPLYTEQYFDLLAQGFPLLKRNFLSENSKDVPDLARWKDLIIAEVPDAPLQILERNLLRVSPDDRLRRSFSLVLDEEGDVPDTRPLGWWQVIEQDKLAPTFSHWWAFPVDPYTNWLSSDQLAVLEAVRNDPTIRKVVLTRDRPVELPGENLETVPLRSLDGQEALLRCGTVFITQTPRASVPYPLSPRRHRFVFVDSAGRLQRRQAGPVADTDDSPSADAERCALAVALSEVDSLVSAAYVDRFDVSRVLLTGAPRHDLLLRESRQLAPELRAQEEAARGMLGDRRLLLICPGGRDRWTEHDPRADRASIKRLVEWCAGNGFLLGYQDRLGDRVMGLSRHLQPLGALRFDRRAFPHVEVLLRAASAVVTDGADAAMDARVLGLPIFLVGEDRPREDLLMPPSFALAASRTRVVEDVGALVDALSRTGLTDCAAGAGFAESTDGRPGTEGGGRGASARLVRMVRQLDVE